MIHKTNNLLASKFEMKDVSAATYVLEIKIYQDRTSKLLYLDQDKYMENILKRFKIDKCKPLSTTISKGQHLSKALHPHNETSIIEMESVPYAQAISSLMYVKTITKPDICHVVGLVSRLSIQSRKDTLASNEENI
jgi:hypothetical protein